MLLIYWNSGIYNIIVEDFESRSSKKECLVSFDLTMLDCFGGDVVVFRQWWQVKVYHFSNFQYQEKKLPADKDNVYNFLKVLMEIM